MKTIYFEQITDSRFTDWNLLFEIQEIEKKIRQKLENLATVMTTPPKEIERDDGTTQQRQKYRIKKNKWVSYDTIYTIINSVNAVPYKLI